MSEAKFAVERRRAMSLLLTACLAPKPALSQPASPTRPTPPGPDLRVKITDEYAALVGGDAYFWGWPLVNIYNRRLAASRATKSLNRMAVTSDSTDPADRLDACPNPDLVHGLGVLALDLTPVVLQVPDFGDRFWLYQAVDLRTDSFAQLGKMYGTKPGFYLVAGPDWHGKVHQGIAKMFRASTNTGVIAPGIFVDDTPEDKRALHVPLRQVLAYPLSEYDGTMKSLARNPIPQPPALAGSEDDAKWVVPEKFVDELGAVLADAPPLPGEEARYAEMRAVLEAAKDDPQRKEALTNAAIEADAKLVAPLGQFRAWGRQLPNHWSTIANGAAFGTDYFTRTAVARSNILVNAVNETKYFYQDLDGGGARLNGGNRYTVTFPKGLTPPVNGLWSLALYDQHHFFAPNDIKRYAIGSSTRNLKLGSDGALTIYIQADPPPEDQRANWLPAPKDADFSLCLRAYWPKPAVVEGAWTPPAVENVT